MFKKTSSFKIWPSQKDGKKQIISFSHSFNEHELEHSCGMMKDVQNLLLPPTTDMTETALALCMKKIFIESLTNFNDQYQLILFIYKQIKTTLENTHRQFLCLHIQNICKNKNFKENFLINSIFQL